MLFEFSIGLALLFIGYLLLDKYYLSKKRQDLGQRIRILLFEQVGNDKIFRGEYQAFEENDPVIGVYIKIKGIKKAIEIVNNDDYFPDVKFGKCLQVCKFADDDYRAIAPMRDNEWYKKVALPPEEYLETKTIPATEDKPETVELVLDDEGEPVRKTDDDGEPLDDFELKPYKEPIGVTQDYREALRFARSHEKRMEEKRKKDPGFWEKYGQLMALVFVIGMFCMTIMYLNNKNVEFMDKMVSTFGQKADTYTQAIKDPTFAENFYKNWDQKQKQKDPPPK